MNLLSSGFRLERCFKNWFCGRQGETFSTSSGETSSCSALRSSVLRSSIQVWTGLSLFRGSSSCKSNSNLPIWLRRMPGHINRQLKRTIHSALAHMKRNASGRRLVLTQSWVPPTSTPQWTPVHWAVLHRSALALGRATRRSRWGRPHVISSSNCSTSSSRSRLRYCKLHQTSPLRRMPRAHLLFNRVQPHI